MIEFLLDIFYLYDEMLNAGENQSIIEKKITISLFSRLNNNKQNNMIHFGN